jgi:hypothetical protein
MSPYYFYYSLKEVVSLRAIKAAAIHAAVLESGDLNCMDISRSDRVFRSVPFHYG